MLELPSLAPTPFCVTSLWLLTHCCPVMLQVPAELICLDPRALAEVDVTTLEQQKKERIERLVWSCLLLALPPHHVQPLPLSHPSVNAAQDVGAAGSLGLLLTSLMSHVRATILTLRLPSNPRQSRRAEALQRAW